MTSFQDVWERIEKVEQFFFFFLYTFYQAKGKGRAEQLTNVGEGQEERWKESGS